MAYIRIAELRPGLGPMVMVAPDMHRIIYALIDPRDSSVRYIGVTGNSLDRRLHEHIAHPTNKHVSTWLASLSVSGLKPEIEPIELCHFGIWATRERLWIARARELGAMVLNVHRGGRIKPGKKDRGWLARLRSGRLEQAAHAGPVIHMTDSQIESTYGVKVKRVERVPPAPEPELSPVRKRVRDYIRRNRRNLDT